MTNAADDSSFPIKSLKEILHAYKVLSSAKLHMSVPSAMKNRSFKSILNNSGPRIDPWGTPRSNYIDKLYELFIFVLCHLFLK